MDIVSCPWLEKQVWPSSLTQVGHHVTPALGLGCGTHPVSLGHQGPRSCTPQLCSGEMVEQGSEPWTASRALEPDSQSPAGHWEWSPWGWVGRADPRRPRNSSTERVPRPLVARPWGTRCISPPWPLDVKVQHTEITPSSLLPSGPHQEPPLCHGVPLVGDWGSQAS